MADITGGWAGKLLRVDLTTRKTWTEPSTQYGQQYIGGRGLAARVAWDEIERGTLPFDPENRIIFAVGPLTGTSAPNSGRSTVCSLSPQAHPYEWFSYSSFGGNWGPTLKYAGYDAIVVQGCSERPVYLWVDDHRVELRDATELWGKGIYATQEILLRRHGKDVRVLAIGQAGENLSRIAIIASGSSSAAGQGGFGAVLGAKQLKAIAVRGTGGVSLAHPEAFSDCTLAVAKEMHAPSGCPRWSELSPELVDSYGERFAACTQGCANPICRLSRYYSNVPGVVYPNRKYSGTICCESSLFAGAAGTIYDWKIGFRGGYELAHISQDYGLNHWELGIGMAPWLRKCYEAGERASFAGLTPDGEPFDLDRPQCWDTLFRKIVFREGIGDALAEGTVRAAEILGIGREFVRDYYTAWGFAGHWDGHGDRANLIVFPYWLVPALQWATSTRDPMASGHAYAQNIMNWSPMFSGTDGLGWEEIAGVAAKVYGTREAAHPLSGYTAKAFPAVWHGHRSIIKDSVTVDDQAFPRIYSLKTPDHFARAENGMPGPSFEYEMFRRATGMEISEADFEEMAERVFNLERAVQVRNWDRSRAVDESVIPHFSSIENWVNPVLGEGVGLDPDKFGHLLDEYYLLRGWDVATGRPTTAKLRELGLGDVGEDLARLGLAPEVHGKAESMVRVI